MRTIITVLAVLAATVSVAGCGAAPDSIPSQSTAATTTVTSTPDAASGQSWTMPDLIGKNLQDAQNAIQSLTDNAVFFTRSTDLTGQDRKQVMDRNWQVCSSTPPPGTAFTRDTSIDFGVVRIDGEPCP